MEYGLGIPTRGPLATRESIEAIATRAEALGFSWLAVSDHLIVPRAIDSRYPYSDSAGVAELPPSARRRMAAA